MRYFWAYRRNLLKISSVFVRKCVPYLIHTNFKTFCLNSFWNSNVNFQTHCLKFYTHDFKNMTATIGIKYLQDLRDNPKLVPKDRINKLNELWKNLENSLTLQEQHFILKLDCLMKCKQKVVPKLFLKEVTDAGLEKTEQLLRKLLSAVAEHGDVGYVSSVVTSMKARNFEVDEGVFASLIIAYGVSR